MHEREAALEVVGLEVTVEIRDALREHEALVDDGLRGEARDVEVATEASARAHLAGALADHEERALERVTIRSCGQ